ncbi:MAG: PDZ domain-containing protein [Armatimonadota bacterium]
MSRLRNTKRRMMRYPWLFCLVLLAACSAALAEKPATSRTPRAVLLVEPAVVRIHVVQVDYSSGHEQKEEAYGSGVIISADGYVVTNHHVAGDGKYFTCTLTDKQEIDAKLIGSDPLTDLAVLKLQPESPRTFPYARFGNSDTVEVGDTVFAIGSPLTLDQSVTKGMVSNAQMTKPAMAPDEWFVLDGEDLGAVIRWIGHDADIYPGNSGGPLVNMRGEIIGINELSMGLSGAIPSNLVREITTQLMKTGKVVRGWLGFSVQPLLRTSAAPHGVLITGFLDDSPAQRAGFQSGDILQQLNGKPVDVHLQEELPIFNLQVMALPIGQPVSAVVLRNGKTVTLPVVASERPVARQRPQEFAVWGICACDIGLLSAREMQRDTSAGIMIVSLRSGGPAESAKPSLQERDIITNVAGEPIGSLRDFERITKTLTAGKTDPVPVVVSFDRRAERIRTVVKLGIDKTPDPGREVRKAWLPVGLQVLTTELAAGLKLDGTTGVCITRVYANTSAEKAGLKTGDIIIAFDGEAIDASRPEDIEVLPAMVRQYAIGSTVKLTILREGKEQAVPITLEGMPAPVRAMSKYRNEHFEFTVREIAFTDRANIKWGEDAGGALVDSVTEGGWAALGHLATNDLIIAVNYEPVKNIEALKAIMQRLLVEHPDTVVVQVKRGIRTLFLEWKGKWVQPVKDEG